MRGLGDNRLKVDMKAELLALLGPEGYLLLLEHYAGVRLYVPKMGSSHPTQLIDDLTLAHAKKLSEQYGAEYIKVPLDREFRALAYRQRGFSTRKIVRLLGLTESGLERLWSRLRER